MKKELRKNLLAQRSNLSDEDLCQKSSLIIQKLLALPAWQSSQLIMVYLDFRKEVVTSPLIEHALAKGKQIAVPICKKEGSLMTPSEICNYPLDLAPGLWGILEPRTDCLRPVKPENIDLILIPGVGFDPQGNRLGYGAGYYDRFLPKLRSSAAKVALAFDLQIVEHIQAGEHDVPMDMIITESRVIVP